MRLNGAAKIIFRPLNDNERRERAFSIVHTPSPREIAVKDKSFVFDKVFGIESTQVSNELVIQGDQKIEQMPNFWYE
jgi:hypothetical protein